ncbi:zinc transport system permease protein [Lachnospiraceae bacterium KHCPX20]|nr:zinc transport system permease protein [Lachnospiraceae bacterium KHCPX20]
MSTMLHEFFQYDFIRIALVAILLMTPMYGMVGTLVVEKKMAYFSDALGHSALTGIAVGVLCQVVDSQVAMIGYAVVFALLLNQIRFRGKASTDTIISVCASVSLAAGLAILSRGGNFSNYASLLVGDVLSMSRKDLVMLLILLVIAVIYYIFCVNASLAVTIHPTLAKAKGYRVRLLENLFAVLVAVMVTLSIRWIGILLINALLILPAAASRNIASNMRQHLCLSIVFSVLSGLLGLFLSYFVNVATGPVIVIFAGILYFATLVYSAFVRE